MSSCSQNCENCGPSLSLFSIGAAEAVSPSAFGCLNGDPLPEGTLGYQSYSSTFAGSSTYSSDFNCFGHYGEGPGAPGFDAGSSLKINSYSNGNASSTYSINGMVNQYGTYFEKSNGQYSINSSSNSTTNSYWFYQTPVECSPYNDSYSDRQSLNCKLVECNFNDVCGGEPDPCGYYVCEESCKWNYKIQGCLPGPPDGQQNISDEGTSCGDHAGPGCDPLVGGCSSVSCSIYNVENVEGGGCEDGGPAIISINSSDAKVNLSSQVTVEKAKGYSKSCVNTRIGILQSNRPQGPCGSNCGEGADACWSPGFSFLPLENTNNSYYSRAKVKIAASKEQMKDYSSVQGKVYFYQDSLPGCCGGGNPIITTDFSLSSSANFKNGTMCATDVYNFENDSMQAYAGSSIVGCAKITRLSLA